MFQKREIERLQQQKNLLVMQSDLNRLQLAADWQRLRSPGSWISEAGGLMRRHPVLTAGLAAAAGVLAVQAVRKPGNIAEGIGRLGKLASAAFVAWKLFRRNSQE